MGEGSPPIDPRWCGVDMRQATRNRQDGHVRLPGVRGRCGNDGTARQGENGDVL